MKTAKEINIEIRALKRRKNASNPKNTLECENKIEALNWVLYGGVN